MFNSLNTIGINYPMVLGYEPSARYETPLRQLYVTNESPRHSMVYTCYKNVKSLFRQLSRRCVQSSQNVMYHSLENLLHRDTTSSWKRIKRWRNSNTHT